MTHICVSKLTITGSDNGLSPGRRIWTNPEILLIGPLGTKFSEILIEIHTFSFNKMHLKMPSGKWRPFCLGINVLTLWGLHKWLLFYRHFQMHFPEWKVVYFESQFITVNCSCGYNWIKVNIGSGNGLVPLGDKPSPETILTNTYDTIWCDWAMDLHLKCVDMSSHLEKLLFW